MNRLWKSEEISYLTKNYPSFKNKELGHKLKRSRESIKAMAKRLQLRKSVNFKHRMAIEATMSRGRSVWSKQEDDLIRKFYCSLSKEEIGAMLKHRTWSGIKSRASMLGVSRRNLWQVLNIRRSLKGKLNLSNFERGYIACAIDGEGMLTVRGKYIQPEVAVTNTHHDFILYCKKLLTSGKIWTTEPKGNRKIKHVLRILDVVSIYKILVTLRDSLNIKRPQAELILKIISLKYNGKASKEEIEKLGQEIRLLNRRGKR